MRACRTVRSAAKAGVTPSLVQYYFPTLDDIFLAAITRYSERNLRLLAEALESPHRRSTARRSGSTAGGRPLAR